MKAKEIHLEILRQPKTTKNGEIIPFTNTNNSNNPIIFPIKQCPTDCQVSNYGRLLCRFKFESDQKNHEARNCGKNCVSCLYLLLASSYLFWRVDKTFSAEKFL